MIDNNVLGSVQEASYRSYADAAVFTSLASVLHAASLLCCGLAGLRVLGHSWLKVPYSSIADSNHIS